MRPGEGGFTYVAVLIAVAAMGGGLAAYGTFASHAMQREKEAQLLFVGNQYRQAIESYYRRSPGNARYPQGLAELLEDRRFPMPVRHLRRSYRDPVTGSAEWGLVEAPEGGIMGVYSRSEESPVKSKGFAKRDEAFNDAKRYADWRFLYQPPSPPEHPAKS